MNQNSAAAIPSASDIFSTLLVTDVFDPRGSLIEEKRQIFERVWASGIISWLQANFDSSGVDRRYGKNRNGFGFLVEAFARASNQLPMQNTEKGKVAARAILSELDSGDRGEIKLGSRQSNSDFLFVDLVGRLITIVGIGEVKASYKAALESVGGQMKRQEKSVEFLVEALNSAKTKKSIQGFFQKRGIVVSDNLRRFLILPFGQGSAARANQSFQDWQIVEIEFSYQELSFIAKQVWPDYRPEFKIGPGKLAGLDQLCVRLGQEWARPHFDRIFVDSTEFSQSNPLPYFELGLFTAATGKTPLLEEEVRWATHLVRECFWPAAQNYLLAEMASSPAGEFTKREREEALIKKFWYFLTPVRSDVEGFVRYLCYLNKAITNVVRQRHQVRRLKALSGIFEEQLCSRG